MFNFLKELWLLIRMLFQSKPTDFEELELMETNYFPLGDAAYLTWCGKCVYRKTNNSITGNPTKYVINHENIHLAQAKDYKSWLRYYTAYLWQWIKSFPPLSNRAYYLNKFEIEAYAKDHDLDYLKSRKHNAADEFDFPEKFNAWKNSATPSEYVIYIKNKFS